MQTQNRKTPQLEDGYTRIANQLLEDLALKIHLSGNEWKVVLIVIRKTYGFSKKMDAISLTQFQKMTGLSRPSVVEAIEKLVGKNLLVVNKEPYINLYSLNKDSGLWLTSKDIGTSRGFGIKLVGKKEHTKERKEKFFPQNIRGITAPSGKLEGKPQLMEKFQGKTPVCNEMTPQDEAVAWNLAEAASEKNKQGIRAAL